MKGYANIVVKGKNGEVKREFTEGNVVFDLPRILLQKCLDNVEFGYGTRDTSLGIDGTYSSEPFQAVVLYDKAISTTNPADIKVPIIYGGVEPRSTTGNLRYAQRNSVVYGANDSSITQNWVWSITEDMTLRSMALKRSISYIGRSDPELGYSYKIGDKYLCYMTANISNNRRKFGIASVGPSYIKRPRKLLTLDKISTTESTTNAKNVWPLCHDNEYVWLEGTSSAPVFNVYDANSGTVKRSFPASQFASFPYPTDLSYAIRNTIVVSTASKDYVWCYHRLYVLPRSQSSDTINITDTLSAAVSSLSEYLVIYNNVIFTGSSVSSSRAFEIDTSNDTLFEYSHQYSNSGVINATDVPVQCMNGEFSVLQNTGPSGPMYNFPSAGDYLCIFGTLTNGMNWLHHTALNFSSPLELTAGDTLSVTYTVSAV